MRNMGIGARLSVLLAIMLILVVVVTGLGVRGMSAIHGHLQTVYADRAVPLGQLSAMLDDLQRMRNRLISAMGAADDGERAKHLADLPGFDRHLDEVWAEYMATYLTPEEADLAKTYAEQANKYRSLRDRVTQPLSQGDVAAAKVVLDADGGRTFETLTRNLKALIDLQVRVAKEEFDASEETFASVMRIIIVVAVLGMMAALAIAFAIGRSITVPVRRMVGIMDRLARGDLDAEVFGRDRGDEVGHIAAAVQVFKQNALDKRRMEVEQAAAESRAGQERLAARMVLADQFQADVGHTMETVSSASHAMQGAAQTLSALSGQVSAQAAAVAAASAQAAANVETVAAATEELSSSVAEIGRQVADSATVAKDAVDEAAVTDTIVRGLADTASRIGDIIQLINAIAAQTNLLALNATIEAARAGDAGKGFAVVANEVKNLANQTAKATEEIAQQVNAVQGETNRAVGAIRHVVTTIGRMDGIAAAIASAVEQQAAATQEIARNVEQAALGTHEVSANIDGVTHAAQQAGDAAHGVLATAQGLAQDSRALNAAVDGFLASVRAG
ncbi:MAG: MCP four helix bundle domain-containing protein [Rhodospirillaceae bacterium]|nr:MCP four helix bundle domain-containing protein [Rhodospirillales bacterium]